MAEDLPRFIKQMAAADEAVLEEYRPRVVTVLMGPAKEPHLQLRRTVRDALAKEGYRILILEDSEAYKGETLEAKWKRMIETEKPTHFFIVIPKSDPARSVHNEFGFLMARYGVNEFRSRVRFFLEDGTNTEQALSAYELEHIGLVGVDYYKDPEQLARRMARRIDNLVYEAHR